jgi:hypothetical protein
MAIAVCPIQFVAFVACLYGNVSLPGFLHTLHARYYFSLMLGRLKPVHLPDSVGPAHKVRPVTLRRTMTTNANTTKIGADIIHMVESDDEVQCVSHKQATWTQR